MLSKLDIDSYWYKQQKYLISGSEELTGSNRNGNKIILFDPHAWRVFALCKHISTASSMHGYNSQFVVVRVNHTDKRYCDLWRWRRTFTGIWTEDYSFEDEHQLAHAILVNQKCFALDSLYNFSQISRDWNLGYDEQQAAIYTSKYLEAKEILERGITEDTTYQYPLVTSYADLKNISLVESAKLIKLQYDMKKSYLAENEKLRLKYKKMFMEQPDLQSLNQVYEQFLVENSKYGSI